MDQLTRMTCVACRGDEPTLTEDEIGVYLAQVPGWLVRETEREKRIQCVYKLKNFVEALAFTNKVGALAEEQGHHPLIITEWGRVTVQWWTHKIAGLHKNDFIMAAKTDELFNRIQKSGS